MTGLKSFRLVPFCLLLLAGNVFAAGNGTSGDDFSNYAKVMQITIQSKIENLTNDYEGQRCSIRIHLARDGSLLGFNTEGGAPDFCNKVSDVMRGINKLPTPPSDDVYQNFKDARLDFQF